ncbi:MAG TPA: zinc ABC transporter substrate-binding protein [Thermomicrobiales bacterium]|nr:zinc ABC transporter substrate-binding protein [Thermomicrobiales bacterium]
MRRPARTVDICARRTLALATVAALALSALLAACVDDDAPAATADRLSVVATTTHIADFARQVAGDRADVTSLLPPNADAHDFEPAPRDVETVADAGVVLRHGMDLDDWATGLISESGTGAAVHVVTDGIIPIAGDHDEDDEQHEEDEHDEDEDDRQHDGDDPHVWFDVANAKIMVENVRDALIEADPGERGSYEANAAAYLVELDELDGWIREQIATIPEENRKLVTNHDAFGYYVRAYGLEFIGAVIPGIDAQAQPSAQHTARLIDLIQEENVRAIFTETSINPDLSSRIADEAGVTLVDDLHGDSLGDADSGAGTYIEMMRWNTTLIVEALR